MAGRGHNMMYVNPGPEEDHIYEPYDNHQAAEQSPPPLPAPRQAQVADQPPEKKTNGLKWLTVAFVVTTFILVGVITWLFVRSENQIEHLQQENNKTNDITEVLQNDAVSLLQKQLKDLQSETALLRKQVFDMKEFSGHLRLSNGSSSNEGRVEVRFMGHWGTICDDNWGEEESAVVCRELGKASPTAWDEDDSSTRLFGAGTGPIWMHNVKCNGNESKLNDCYFKLALSFNMFCGHEEDVGVKCGL